MAEDVGSVTLGLQSMTVANLEEMTGTDTMMRPNFPLPRELRDQIYSYLLCAEHVYEDRWYKLPPGRRGDVCIFRGLLFNVVDADGGLRLLPRTIAAPVLLAHTTSTSTSLRPTTKSMKKLQRCCKQTTSLSCRISGRILQRLSILSVFRLSPRTIYTLEASSVTCCAYTCKLLKTLSHTRT